MAIGDVYRAAVVGRLGNEAVVNVTHWKMKTNVDGPSTISTYLKTALYSLYKARCVTNVSWNQVQVRKLAVPLTGADIDWNPAETGAIGSTAWASSVAVVASLRTGYAGRRYRGRLYLPGISPNYYSSGTVLEAQRTGIQTMFDDMVAAVGANGANADLTWGVFSRKYGEMRGSEETGHQIIGYDLTAFTPITAVLVRSPLGQMRTRAVGHGI